MLLVCQLDLKNSHYHAPKQHPPPPLLLLSHDIPERELLSDALTMKADRKVEVLVPARGEKREIVLQACHNARAQLMREQAENASHRALLTGVQETFALAEPPKRIEVYDNSHIQGSNAVGAMIVAGPEGFQKGEYRKFNIKSTELTPGDDFGMMREVLTKMPDYTVDLERSVRFDDAATMWGWRSMPARVSADRPTAAHAS